MATFTKREMTLINVLRDLHDLHGGLDPNGEPDDQDWIGVGTGWLLAQGVTYERAKIVSHVAYSGEGGKYERCVCLRCEEYANTPH